MSNKGLTVDRYSGCDEARQDHGVWETRLRSGGSGSNKSGQGGCGSPETVTCYVHACFIWRPHVDWTTWGHCCQVGFTLRSDLFVRSLFSASSQCSLQHWQTEGHPRVILWNSRVKCEYYWNRTKFWVHTNTPFQYVYLCKTNNTQTVD